MYNPFMMNPMGGGGMNYWNPQNMQAAQPMMGMAGGSQQSPGDARIDKLKGRISNLQEQYKGAGSEQQAGIQARMDQLQGRVKGLRQDRRRGQGMYDPQAQGADGGQVAYAGGTPGFYGNQQGLFGGMGFGGMGFGGFGGMPQMGGFPMMGMMPQMGGGQQMGPIENTGMYAPPTPQQMQEINAAGAARAQQQGRPYPVAPYNPQAPAPQPQPQAPQQSGRPAPMSMGNMFDTGWGRLVPSSVGNQNVFQLENDPNKLFHFDPRAVGNDGAGVRGGWKSMTPESYASYGDYNYYDPRQAGAAASPMMQDWTFKNGMWQGKVGTGSYA